MHNSQSGQTVAFFVLCITASLKPGSATMKDVRNMTRDWAGHAAGGVALGSLMAPKRSCAKSRSREEMGCMVLSRQIVISPRWQRRKYRRSFSG